MKKISACSLVLLSSIAPNATAMAQGSLENAILPTVVLHGFNNDADGMQADVDFIKQASPKTTVVCPSLPFNGFELCQAQVDMLAGVVSQHPELKEGLNLIGYSLGGLITRAAVEQGKLPRVYTLVNLAAPQRGICGFPYTWDDRFDQRTNALIPWDKSIDEAITQHISCCKSIFDCIRRPCESVEKKVYRLLSSRYLQSLTSIANIWHEPGKEKSYRKNNLFLPLINNEKKHPNQNVHASNLASVATFLNLSGSKETTVEPACSTNWDYPKGANRRKIEPLEKSSIYTQLGLQDMERSGAFIRETVVATHGSIHQDRDIYNNTIIPRLARESDREIDSGSSNWYEETK